MKKRSTSQINFDNATDAEQARELETLSTASLSGALGLPVISSRDWQREREKRLHQICSRIKARLANGQSLNKACRVFSRRWSGKPFKSDPSRRYALNVSSVYRHYRAWLRAGELPSAFRLKFFPTSRRIPATVLVRFVELCAKQEFPSFRAAHQAFCRRGGNSGPGRCNGHRLKLGYHSLYWNLPKSCFAEFKHCWKTIRQAQRKIAELRFGLIAEIRARVPDRPPRRRVKREVDFQI